MEISETSPGKWKIKTSTTLKSMEINFELGKAFDEKALDGRDVSTTVTQVSRKVIQNGGIVVVIEL